MTQATAINFKSIVWRRKRKTAITISVGVLVFALAIGPVFYWWHLNHVKAAASARRPVPASVKPASAKPSAATAAAVKPVLASSSPGTNDHLAFSKKRSEGCHKHHHY